MNGFGATPDHHHHQAPAQNSTSKTTWSLPCQLPSLTLMNCKSRAEAFAQSLHSKLRSLSRMTGDCDGDEEDGGVNGHGGGEGGEISNAGAINEDAGSPITFDFGNAGKNNYPYNERTHLMTTSIRENGRLRNTSTGSNDEELNYDLGFYSPESPNELPSQLLLLPAELVNSCLDDNASSPRINGVQIFNEDNVQEESGCISSVSSVLTEQDNIDDDDERDDNNYNFDYLTSATLDSSVSPSPPITKQPKKVFNLPLTEDSSTVSEAEVLMPNNPAEFYNWESLKKNESGFMPNTRFLKKDNLEQGRGAINFENSTKVVDIEDDSDGGDKSQVEEDQTSADNDTFNNINGVSYMTVNMVIESNENREFDPSSMSQLISNVLPITNGSNETWKGDVQLSVSPSPKSNEIEYADYSINFTHEPTLHEDQNIVNPNDTSDETSQHTLIISSFSEDPQEFRNELTNGISEEANSDKHELLPEISKQSNGKLFVQLSVLDVEQYCNDSGDNTPTSPFDELPVRVRRSSSLKTCKTPPGTPNRKKIVRFADALGLDLEAVKTVFLDDLPVVPSSAFNDLESSAYNDDDDEEIIDENPHCMTSVIENHGLDFVRPKSSLIPIFPQPGSLPDFFDRLRKQSVCLESAVVTGLSTLRLVIRVLNIDFHKTVIVRYTTSEWRVFQDVIAEYVNKSNDVFSDKFHTVITSNHLQVGERLSLAINYKVNSKQFWDNNGGQNYIFQCFPEHERHLSPTDDSWIHFQ